MSKNWPTVELGSVLSLDLDRVSVDVATSYPMVGVLSFGRGLFDREPVENGKTSYKVFYRLKAEHVVMSQLFGWEGAIALSSDRFAGRFLSPQFPTFRCDTSKLDRDFLGWLIRQPKLWEDLGTRTSGMGDRRRTLNPGALFACKIPLPPLADQRRIVARIESLARLISEASDLREHTAQEAEAFFASALNRACVGELTLSWRRQNPSIESARDLLSRISKTKCPGQVKSRERKPITLPQPPVAPRSWLILQAGELQDQGAILDIQDGNHGGDYPRKMEFGHEGVPFVTAKQIENGTVRMGEAPRLPKARAERLRIGFARAGDVLLTHNASVGDVAIAPADAGDFLLGTSVTYWRCNKEALEPRYLFYFMRSEQFQGQLHSIMQQTTRNQVSVLKQVNLWICLPPVLEQRQIVAELDTLEKQVDNLKRLQSETSSGLDALLPSILDKAFRGEL